MTSKGSWWPQSYVSELSNIHIKDKLENKLHALVCSGQITIEEAQREIAGDWVGAYHRWVSQVP